MATLNSPMLVNVFGQEASEINEVVKDFDFKKIVVGQKPSDVYLHTEIAPSFGGPLEKELLKDLDDKLKVMIAGTLMGLGKLPKKNWTEIMSHMMQTSFLNAEPSVVHQANKLVKSSATDFKLDGNGSEHDIATVKEVQMWFEKLVNDEDVVANTRIDFDVLAAVVAQAASAIESFFALHEKKEIEQPLIDISVLRFPDAKRPYFKLYNLKITAWVDSSRTLWVGEDKNGLTGKFTSRIFRPRDTVIDSMNETARANAVAKTDEMIDSLTQYTRDKAVAAATALFED